MRIDKPFSKHGLKRSYLVLTAIGITIHELAHKKQILRNNLEVHDFCYFQIDKNPVGYVKHEPPRTYREMLSIAAAPFLFNSSLAYACFVIPGIYIGVTGIESLSAYDIITIPILIYIGIASGLHAFPSAQDIHNITSSATYLWEKTPPINIFHRYTPTRVQTLTKGLRFSHRHFGVILSLPFIAMLVILDRLKPIGSNIIFTACIMYFAYFTTITISPAEPIQGIPFSVLQSF